MSEKKPMPKCPYCGAKMALQNNMSWLSPEDVKESTRYWYCCGRASCWSISPSRHTAVEAYRAAMTRYEEPNRVLTLDEVFVIACNDYNTEQETAMYLECREDNEGYAIVTDVETDGSKILLEFSGVGGGVKQNEKDYGSLWRCWRRKPTKNERENTPWEESKNEV